MMATCTPRMHSVQFAQSWQGLHGRHAHMLRCCMVPHAIPPIVLSCPHTEPAEDALEIEIGPIHTPDALHVSSPAGA